MTVNPIQTDYFPPEETHETQNTSAVESTAFSEVLTRSSLNPGSVDLDAIFEAAGLRYNISPNLLKAVARVESNFRPDATSRSGAMGIMQLMPGTARGLGVTDAYDPEQNIMGGAKFLRQMLDQFGDIQLALAAYNAGPNNVTKYGGIPPFEETQNYVKKVMEYLGGGDISAGWVSYGGSSEKTGAAKSSMMNEAFTQMLLVKIIEMQMNSSKDDKDKNKVFYQSILKL